MIALAHRIPGEAACARARDIHALRARTTALVNAGKIPAALQESLSSGVNALVALAPTCLPPVQASSPTPAPAPPSTPSHGAAKQHGHGHGHGHHEKKKK